MVIAVLSSNVTKADDIKPVPLMVRVNGVALVTSEMLSELMEGTRFSRVTVADAIWVGSAVLTASTVMTLTEGTIAGAV